MLVLKLVNETATEATYNYYPEGKEMFGALIVNKVDGDIAVSEVAENDEFRRYLGHAVPKIKEFYEAAVYEKEALVAWY